MMPTRTTMIVVGRVADWLNPEVSGSNPALTTAAAWICFTVDQILGLAYKITNLFASGQLRLLTMLS